ncbi:MAG: LysR substrate-binding domain-containing protein [Steroidobacteraceae bacterium]
MRSPSLKFLKTFHIAGRRGSFKAAADELCITASAVSHQIKLLEDQLGIALFERGPRSLSLTEAGSHYLESIEALFARLDAATEQLHARFSRNVVRLQVPPFFASELLVPRLGSFSAIEPETDLQIHTRITANQEHPPEADVSVVIGTGPWPDVQATRLFPQTFVAACAPALMRNVRGQPSVDLADQALIVHEDRIDMWHRWVNLRGLGATPPKQVIRFDSMSAVVHAAEQGVGVALVSAPLAASRFRAGTLRKIHDMEIDTGESYFVVARPEDAGRPGIKSLIGWMQQQFSAVA